jgi:hypothetical protein
MRMPRRNCAPWRPSSPAARYLALGRDNEIPTPRGVSGLFDVRNVAEMLIAGRSGSFRPG